MRAFILFSLACNSGFKSDPYDSVPDPSFSPFIAETDTPELGPPLPITIPRPGVTCIEDGNDHIWRTSPAPVSPPDEFDGWEHISAPMVLLWDPALACWHLEQFTIPGWPGGVVPDAEVGVPYTIDIHSEELDCSRTDLVVDVEWLVTMPEPIPPELTRTYVYAWSHDIDPGNWCPNPG